MLLTLLPPWPITYRYVRGSGSTRYPMAFIFCACSRAAARLSLALTTFSGGPRRIQGISPSTFESKMLTIFQEKASTDASWSLVIRGSGPLFALVYDGAVGFGGSLCPAWSMVTW